MATRKTTSTRRPNARRSRATKDPEGGLTAAGRAHFKKTEGANLKPGVKSVKSAEDMRRKGSFLRRHYGKKTISPLTDADGKPTRYALQAHAWGEPVPKTAAAVNKLAAKGTALLERYHKQEEKASASKTSRSKSTRPAASRARRRTKK